MNQATSIQELRERRNVLVTAIRKFHDDRKDRRWTTEEQERFDAQSAEIEDIDNQIGRHQRLLDLEAENRIPTLSRTERIEIEGDPNSPRALFNTWMRRGDKGITADQWAQIRNTLSTTTGSEGGYTVQTEVAKMIMDALKQFGGMRAVADVIQTAQGNDMSFPTSDGTSEVGELIAQNVTATPADPTFGAVTLSVYKFSSKIVACPIELLQDSSVDIEAFILGRLRTRLGRITNTYFTTGTGSSQPRGIVTAAGSGKVGTTGQTLTVIYDDLVDLVHSVDPAYRERGTCRFMMNDASVKVIRKLKDSQNRPIWMPSYDAGIRGAVPQELLGYPIQVNQDVAVMAANAKSILFGDFKDYKIRDVMEATLFRFTDSAYAKLGQVGFLMWMRSGGNYVDVAPGVKYYQNSAT